MNTKEAQHLAEISCLLTVATAGEAVNPFRIVNQTFKLARLGKEAHTHAERQCNEPLTDEYCSKKRASIARRALACLAEMKITDADVEVHGDPRGSCLQITLKGAVTALRF